MLYEPEHLERWSDRDPCGGSTDNYGGEDLSAFYVAPISIGRDTSDAVTLSNWRFIGAELEKLAEHEDSGEHRFGHWAVGWYELWLIHESDAAALQCADEWACALSDYPIANEEDCSALELEAEQEAWESWGESEWRTAVVDALQEYAPEDADRWWADELLDDRRCDSETLAWLWRECGGQCHHESDGPSFDIRRAAESLTAALLSEALELVLLPPHQQWRRKPYPWSGAEPAPLVPPLPAL